MKVVINKDYGGFGLSFEARKKYAERKGIKLYYYATGKSPDHKYYIQIKEEDANKLSYNHIKITKDLGEKVIYTDFNVLGLKYLFSDSEIDRADLDLVWLVENMKEKANGAFAELKIVEIPDEVSYQIQEYDGKEWVAEKHQTWS